MGYRWSNYLSLENKKYICGYCSAVVGPNEGYVYGYKNSSDYHETEINYSGVSKTIYICPNCNNPTFFDFKAHTQTPGPIYGNYVDKLPEDIERLYDEARRCYSIGAFDAVAMISRKIIMNTAVSEGAEENKNFIEYVEFLDRENIIPKNAKKWVNKLRELGNKANHEIENISKEQAEEAIKFVEVLLRNVYEMKLNDY